MSGCNIGDHFRDEERVELGADRVFDLCVTQYFLIERFDTADSGSKDNTDTVLVLVVQVHSRIFDRLLCGIYCE